MKTLLFIFLATFAFSADLAFGFLRFSPSQMEEVKKIARDITLVQAGLRQGKLIQYAAGIYRASKQYSLDPHLLISIAQQETSFREDLPEGKAGELGICQIRKMWVKNPLFVKEFPNAKQADLLDPNKNFMFAAWILNDLRKNEQRDTIPYWSFYNARKFINRFKYYIAVNRFLGSLKVKSVANRLLASTDDADYWTPEPKPEKKRSTAIAKNVKTVAQNTVHEGWIPTALRKLNEDGRPAYYQDRKTVLPAMIRAANELNVPTLFRALPVQD